MVSLSEGAMLSLPCGPRGLRTLRVRHSVSDRVTRERSHPRVELEVDSAPAVPWCTVLGPAARDSDQRHWV